MVSGLILILCVLVPKHQMRNRVSTGLNSVAAKAAYVFMAVAGGGLLASLLKNVIGRARPSQLAEYGSFYFKLWHSMPTLRHSLQVIPRPPEPWPFHSRSSSRSTDRALAPLGHSSAFHASSWAHTGAVTR